MSGDFFLFNFAGAIAMMLVIYASYLILGKSKGELANAFRITLAGHIPSAVVHFLRSLSYFGIKIFPEGEAFYWTLNQGVQIIAALSVLATIYIIKKTLFDKIANFTKKIKVRTNE